MEEVILVDNKDNPIGTMEKMQVHVEGKLHRAFSVFVLNANKELLLQRRALTKYHSAGLWTNTCCSHPRPNEATEDAVHRRLQEEMGFDCEVSKAFDFIYKAELENGLIEHELDHVFFGYYNETPTLNKEEAADWKYISTAELLEDLKTNSANYTAWFKHCIKEVVHFIDNIKKN